MDSNRNRLPLVTGLTQVIFTLLSVALTTGILVIFRHELNFTSVAMLFFLPVGLSTALWGLLPGILSALTAFLALNYFFITPYYSLRVHQSQDLLVLVIFLVVAVVINQLVARSQINMEKATAREHETAWLFELSSSLAKIDDESLVLRNLAEKILVVFQATSVRVSMEGYLDVKATSIQLPTQDKLLFGQSSVILPIQSARGILGEIVIWKDGHALSGAQERLLHAFANQAGLALERVRLSKSEQRARILEESDRLKSALLSSVSHELRTPLATIKASVTSLLSRDLELGEETRQDLLSAIEEETDHLNYLVGNLLDMSRIEAGAIQPQRKWNVLADIVHSAVDRMHSMTYHHPVLNEVSDELPLVPVDFIQIEHVFMNLISNGIKYAPEGTPIHIQANLHDHAILQIQVSNQGPPVPEADLGRIFEKFYRITAADRVTGTGLGLSICKGFVEAHGWRIWAENLPDGFAFYFTLPLTWEGAPPKMPEEL